MALKDFVSETGRIIGEDRNRPRIPTQTIEGRMAGSDRMLYGLEQARNGPRPYLNEDPLRDSFVESNSSYSGCDILPIIQLNQKLIVMGNIHTLDYSTFREKEPIRTLGRSYPKGFTRGSRTIAGTMIFVVFDQNPLYELIKEVRDDASTSDRYTSPIADQLPPVDVTLWFSNEYGHKSLIRLYGLEFVQEGETHSVKDIYTEGVFQYKARDIDTMVPYRDIENFKNLLFQRQLSGQFTDNYLGSMMEYRKKIQRDVANIRGIINRIQQERGRRNIVSFGTTALFGGNADLNDELKKYQTKLRLLINELESINNEILKHEQNIYGWNGQQKNSGVTGREDLNRDVTI